MTRILDSVNQPQDLWELDYVALDQLAAEIREEIIDITHKNGGHLASNLGTVDFTIALHRVFDSPKDKIIWDVGHQSYTHKLLTGRRDTFHTLRKLDGISGFIDPNESPHDAFISGHASNSISAAFGMAMARELAGEDNHVVAILGDGSLTGGMALEALNQAGHSKIRLIVILNDNAMSISPSVGAVANSLNRLRFSRRVRMMSKGPMRLVNKLVSGVQTQQIYKRVLTSVKGLLLPNVMWEELGYTYLGPINGHDIKEVEKALRRARNYADGPVFLHIKTTKGMGYKLAEDDPVAFHGVSAPKKATEALTYARVFAETTIQMMEHDPKVVAITAAMMDGTGLNLVAKRFPDRVLDVGICEQHATTMAAGLAIRGFKPVVAIYSTFLQRAYDQIIHDVCLQDLPVVFAIDRGGIVGDDGKTHQGIFDLSFLSPIPNLIVAAPSDENELQNLLFTAVNANHPMAIRYPRGYGIGKKLRDKPQELPIGKGELIRKGNDVALIAIGVALEPSLKAAEMLEKDGISCSVANARFVKPVDTALILELAGSSKILVTVEENVLSGGLGSTISSFLHDQNKANTKLLRIGLPDQFIEHGTQSQLRQKYKLSADEIAKQIKSSLP
ncbi:1-deoxy-D-xylulose-5-phosphate synthase [Chloroflexota bacterium]